jgi:hypothetical protein
MERAYCFLFYRGDGSLMTRPITVLRTSLVKVSGRRRARCRTSHRAKSRNFDHLEPPFQTRRPEHRAAWTPVTNTLIFAMPTLVRK